MTERPEQRHARLMEDEMSNRVRLIGGSHGGETHVTDAPRIFLPRMENFDVPHPIGPDTTTANIKREEYAVEELRFESGHSHRYGVCRPMRLVDAMNVMWQAYVDQGKPD